MKKMVLWTSILTALSLLVTSGALFPAWAQVTGPQGPQQEWIAMMDLAGAEVVGEGGEVIGRVNNIVVDLETAHVDFITIRPEEEVDPGDRNIPIPWQALEFEKSKGKQDDFRLMVPARAERFRGLPSVRFSPFPVVNRPGWDRPLFDAWERLLPQSLSEPERAAAAQLAPVPVSVLGSNVRGMEIDGQGTSTLGEIEDLFIDRESGYVDYLVLEAAGARGAEREFIPVPLEALDFSLFQRTLILPLSERALARAPELEAGDRQLSEELAEEVNRFFAAQD